MSEKEQKIANEPLFMQVEPTAQHFDNVPTSEIATTVAKQVSESQAADGLPQNHISKIQLVLSARELALLQEMLGNQLQLKADETSQSVQVSGSAEQIRAVLSKLANLPQGQAPKKIEAVIEHASSADSHKNQPVTMVLDTDNKSYIPTVAKGGGKHRNGLKTCYRVQ